MNIIQNPSPNFNRFDRFGNPWFITPKMIVVHWSAGTYSSCINWFKIIKSQVSAHFVIKEDGSEITQMVDLNRRSWQCGGSWHPYLSSDTNSETIGIELAGPPSIIKQDGWNPLQISALIDLCKYIQSQVPSIIAIVDHSTIDPLRKSDVQSGKGVVDLFPWTYLISKLNEESGSEIRDYATPWFRQFIKNHFGMK